MAMAPEGAVTFELTAAVMLWPVEGIRDEAEDAGRQQPQVSEVYLMILPDTPLKRTDKALNPRWDGSLQSALEKQFIETSRCLKLRYRRCSDDDSPSVVCQL